MAPEYPSQTATRVIKAPRPFPQDVPARERLVNAARCDPAAVLGVLEYWLAPRTGEGGSRGDE
jgi:hypothetical protein